jgi:hypothetical protein
VAFVFNAAVTTGTVTGSGWTVTGTGSTTITAEYTGGQYGMQTVSFTAARSGYTSASVSASVVSARAFPDTAAAYTIEYYDTEHHVAAVRKVDGDTVDGFLVANANWQKLFNAIYTPNAPVGAAALKLFNVTIGGGSQPSGKVEIKGTELPAAGGASSANPIVIDIGVPGTVDNDGLNFVIPDRGLGAQNNNGYGHLRLRVNKGASLLIEAENSGYISKGAGSSCPPGYFNNGTIEVMAGGKLRDGAYEGFPLGANAVILTRPGSYLGVGPEADSADAQNGMADTYGKYYSGWLVGPSAVDANAPKIEWNGGSAAGYLEVRPSMLAISTNVTVKKTVGLIYNVWLVGNVTVTINVAAGDKKGLFANGKDYKIYATTDQAEIAVNEGSVLHKAFLTPGGTDLEETIAGAKTLKVTGESEMNSKKYPDDSASSVLGYFDWNLE